MAQSNPNIKATKQYQILQKTAANEYLKLHPETDANIVKIAAGALTNHPEITDVAAALVAMDAEIHAISVPDAVAGLGTGTNNGETKITYTNGATVSTQVVKGLGTAAYSASTDFDAAGTAANAVDAIALADAAGRTGKTLVGFEVAANGEVTGNYQDISITHTQVSDWAASVNKSAVGLSNVTDINAEALVDSIALSNAAGGSNTKTLVGFEVAANGQVTPEYVNIAFPESSVAVKDVKISKSDEDGDGSATVHVGGNYTNGQSFDSYIHLPDEGSIANYVAGEISELNATLTGAPAAGKTLTAFSQTNGKVSATFADINISKAQIYDFPTIPTVNNGSLTITANNGTAETNVVFYADDASDKTITLNATSFGLGDYVGKAAVTTIAAGDQAGFTAVTYTNGVTDNHVLAINGLGTAAFNAASDFALAAAPGEAVDAITLANSTATNKTLVGFEVAANGQVTGNYQDINIEIAQVNGLSASLTGGMHFKGAVESLPPTTGYSEGDVIIIIDSKQEYVCANVRGSLAWVELGTEGAYVYAAESFSAANAGKLVQIDANGAAAATTLNAANAIAAVSEVEANATLWGTVTSKLNAVDIKGTAGANTSAITVTNSTAGNTQTFTITAINGGLVNGPVATANALTTAHNFSIEGDATATAVAFNGTQDVALNVTLAATGVEAGTYSALTVDAKGRATAGAQFIQVEANDGTLVLAGELAVGGLLFYEI